MVITSMLILAAFSGWLIVWLCIKMLFHPAGRITFAGLSIQGILPASRQRIAKGLGRWLADEMLRSALVEKALVNPDHVRRIMPVVEEHIDHFLRNKLPAEMPMIGMLIGDKTITQLKGIFIRELEAIFPAVMKNYAESLKENKDIGEMIEAKIAGMSMTVLENNLQTVLSGELRMARMAGAFIGFLMGLIQVGVMYGLNHR